MSETHPCSQTCAGYVGQAVCKHISSVPAKAAGCIGCKSPWNVGAKPADPNDGLPSVADTHSKFGILSGSSNGGDYAVAATTGGGRQAGASKY